MLFPVGTLTDAGIFEQIYERDKGKPCGDMKTRVLQEQQVQRHIATDTVWQCRAQRSFHIP